MSSVFIFQIQQIPLSTVTTASVANLIHLRTTAEPNFEAVKLMAARLPEYQQKQLVRLLNRGLDAPLVLPARAS